MYHVLSFCTPHQSFHLALCSGLCNASYHAHQVSHCVEFVYLGVYRVGAMSLWALPDRSIPSVAVCYDWPNAWPLWYEAHSVPFFIDIAREMIQKCAKTRDAAVSAAVSQCTLPELMKEGGAVQSQQA